MNDTRLMKRRICKYLIPVSLLSFIVNIPKFFESEVMYTDDPSFLQGYDYDDDVAAMHFSDYNDTNFDLDFNLTSPVSNFYLFPKYSNTTKPYMYLGTNPIHRFVRHAHSSYVQFVQ